MADKIVLVVASEILLADDGQVDFAVSTEATINTGTDVSPVYVNLFQNNLTALRGRRYPLEKRAGPPPHLPINTDQTAPHGALSAVSIRRVGTPQKGEHP